MELIIKLTTEEKYNRRVLNNLLASVNSDIHDFILNSSSSEIEFSAGMGNRSFEVEIEIKE